MKKIAEYTLASAIAPRLITSSTNAAPIVVTTATHGYSTGDRVTIFNHETNTAANGTWTIIVVSTTTFSLTGSTGNGVGINTGTYSIASKIAFCQDADHIKLTVDTDGGGDAAMTVKFAGSHGAASADYAGTKGPTNQYDYIDVIDDEDGSSVDGDDGFIVATADDNRSFSVNTDAIDWFTAVPTAGTEGEVTIKAYLYSIN